TNRAFWRTQSIMLMIAFIFLSSCWLQMKGVELIPQTGSPSASEICLKKNPGVNGSFNGCPTLALEPGSKCKISDYDNSKPYPKCCPNFVC
ncbi:hypothetical protein ILUMI_17450, partial [Ignelater luminosus]